MDTLQALRSYADGLESAQAAFTRGRVDILALTTDDPLVALELETIGLMLAPQVERRTAVMRMLARSPRLAAHLAQDDPDPEHAHALDSIRRILAPDTRRIADAAETLHRLADHTSLEQPHLHLELRDLARVIERGPESMARGIEQTA